MFLLPQRYTSQPPKRSSLDHSCAILDGVSNAFVMYGDQNGWLGNNATGEFGSMINNPTLNGTIASDFGDRGRAMVFDGSTTYVEFPITNVPYDEFTLLFGGVFDNFTSFRGLIDCTGTGTGWNVFQAGGGILWFSINGYGGALSSSGWPSGTMVHGALRNRYTSTCDWFMNGVKTASIAGVLANTPTVPFWIGNQRAGGTSFIQGRFEYFYLLDKYLDDELILDVKTNPWRIFSGNKTIIENATTGAPPVSAPIPVFANHYRNMGIM